MGTRAFKGLTPTLGRNVYIDEQATLIGDITVGDDCSFWPYVIARGDVQKITIGARTNIQDGSVLHVTADNRFNPGGFELSIGNNVTVGHRAVLHACTIRDYCLIGMGTVILDGATIHENTLIAAGSVVSPGKELESGFLWVGQPAKKNRPLSKKELEYLEFSAKHYVELKNEYLNHS
ncbi:Carbonic anhydrase, gamma class [hydrothermal vent metagenome]|uniref:Carbonic anhydrase, gamma class n=1 Tax=hydrothermal vent metagenome TaxID=652676 RepID=A0A3B1A6Y9_9ZZZZ